MRIVDPSMTAAWKGSLKATGVDGGTRPIVRATISKVSVKSTSYNTADPSGGTGSYGPEKDRYGTFTTALFGNETTVYEIPNIKNYSWTRSTTQDVAECTMTILNTELTPIGDQEVTEQASDFDLPGAFTYNRGIPTESTNRWGYTADLGWKNIFVPDRIVRTYEGYGVDYTVTPAYDSHLAQSGTWLIDTVGYTASGDISLRMRDLGRLLIDQISFPPIVPPSQYPMYWEKIRSVEVPGRDATGGSFAFPSGTYSSSNQYYVGEMDPPYIEADGSVMGHRARDAVTESTGDYWLSTGQEKATDKVWWQVDLHDHTTNIAGLRVNSAQGPYRVFISLYHKDRGWLGTRNIRYTPGVGDIDVHADIPFVQAFDVDRHITIDLILKRKYRNISKVRVTFTDLKFLPGGTAGAGYVPPYPWHAGLRKIKLYTAPSYDDLGFDTSGTVLEAVGNIGDFTHIVKWITAWAGWYWPAVETGDDFMMLEDGTKQYYHQPYPDPSIIPSGRVFGRFQRTGTFPEFKMTFEQFDKQPLMDCIGAVRDIVGFSFWVNEFGAVIWRMPNLWSLGNYLTPHHLDGPSYGGGYTNDEEDIVIIDEEETLISYSTTLDSSNIRERIFVAGTTGKIGIVVKGFNPFPSGFRRIAGWTDNHFITKTECRVMADMISAQQMFSYRTAKITIPGYPAIQIDDQVRIYERVTNETYFHYVRGITSNLDMDTGVWTYELDSHWLGEVPEDAWVVDVTELPAVTQQYLNTIGDDDV